MNERYLNTKWDMSDYSSSQREEWVKTMIEEHGASLSVSACNNDIHHRFFIINSKGVLISTSNPNSDFYLYYIWADPTEILPLDGKPYYEELKELSLEVMKNMPVPQGTHDIYLKIYLKNVVDVAEGLYEELKSRTK